MTEHTLAPDLRRLEAESIYIFREVAAEFKKPVLLYSIGKDSSVLLHLARKAFFPSPLPFPLLHIDTTWKFREMIAFRDATAKQLGLDLIVHTNREGIAQGITPFTHGSSFYTHVMKTEALKQALTAQGFDAAFGGARRDEEKSRAKERVFSFRSANHVWDPKNQRPELWHIYNCRVAAGESIRVFRCPIGPSSMSGATSSIRTSRLCRSISQRRARWCEETAVSSWSMTTGCLWSRTSVRRRAQCGSVPWVAIR